jgi:hypothetical protein
VAGLAAVVLSLVQCALGVRLAGWVAPGGDSPRVGSLFQLISRIDGVKMLLLAIFAVSGMTLARRARALPPRPAFPGVVLTAALAGGGFGYLLLSPATSQAVPSDRQTGNLVTAACSSFRPGKPGTVRIPGHSGHSRLTGRGLTALASGNASPTPNVRNHRPLTTRQNLSVPGGRPSPPTQQGTPGIPRRNNIGPGCRPHDQASDGDVHLVSITAAR